MIRKVTTTSNLKPDRSDINTDIGYKFGDDVGLSTDTKATDSITPLPRGVGSLTIRCSRITQSRQPAAGRVGCRVALRVVTITAGKTLLSAMINVTLCNE
ncbi:MAG: hypothetical protein A07HR60_00405 [uncultured archaeon A07HR60]|nr:MAG: hypothetical protein A07HR60_00405 [uncultured archaeon A07HR60]